MESLDGFQAQLYWNGNMSADRLGQYWANYIETGPGLRLRFSSLPKSMLFMVNFVRGVYTVNEGNPRTPAASRAVLAGGRRARPDGPGIAHV